MAKVKIEVSTKNISYYNLNRKKKDNTGYDFIDLRTLVNIEKIGIVKEGEYDFSAENISAKERLYRYQQANLNGFDLDYCRTVRDRYSFIPISKLYSDLWSINVNDTVLNSSETLISPKQTLARVYPQLRRKQRGRPVVDWTLFRDNKDIRDLEEFAYRVATIGNYMPVPSKEQLILNRIFCERFDKLLVEIKKYLVANEKHISFSMEIIDWLNIYKANTKPWEYFVDSNYLKRSFVNDEYEIIGFDGTLSQLSAMIYNRSVVMMEEYDRRIYKNRKPR